MLVNSIRVRWISNNPAEKHNQNFLLDTSSPAPAGQLTAEVGVDFAPDDGAHLYMRMNTEERREFFDMVNRWVERRVHSPVLNADYVLTAKT